MKSYSYIYEENYPASETFALERGIIWIQKANTNSKRETVMEVRI